jgi:hypothetical protein
MREVWAFGYKSVDCKEGTIVAPAFDVWNEEKSKREESRNVGISWQRDSESIQSIAETKHFEK